MLNVISREVFQNVGVWGLDGSPLKIQCEKKLSKIEIFIDSDVYEFLNLKSIEIFAKNGDELVSSGCVEYAQLSSNFYSDKDGSNCILKRLTDKKIIHSRFEKKPKLTIKFKSKIKLSSINIYNRANECGIRSRFIAVKGITEDRAVFEFQNVGPSIIDKLQSELQKLLLLIDHELSVPKSQVYGAKYLRSIIYDLIEAGHMVSDELISALIPISGVMPRLDRLSALHITNFIEKKLQSETFFNTDLLKTFSGVLSDDVSIDVISRFASKMISKKTGGERKVLIDKHKVYYARTVSHQVAHLDFFDQIFASLNNVSGQALIAYGTLLGASRNGNLLPTEDDLHIIFYFPDVIDEGIKETRLSGLLNNLKESGFSVSKQNDSPHLTVSSLDSCIAVSIFPAWGIPESNKVSVVMQEIKYRNINIDLLLPVKTLGLYGRCYPCPANIKDLLAELYGEDWHKTNPYDNWPWRLAQRTYFDELNIAAKYDRRKSERSYRVSNPRTQMVAWSQCVLNDVRPPSNSIPMLLQALEYGYDVVELDIRVTKDKQVVLSHDDKVNNDAQETIVLSNSTLEEALKFRIASYEGDDIYISSLLKALPLLNNKQVLLDARFKAQDYIYLRKCVEEVGFDPYKLIFCVYNEKQLCSLIQHFPESLLFWKFYTQAWELDLVELEQVKQYGVDGIMYLYPYFDENIEENLYQIKSRNLQSMCFIHGSNWTHPYSCGLNDYKTKRSGDGDYEASLKRMVSMGIEYVTTTACRSEIFDELIRND